MTALVFYACSWLDLNGVLTVNTGRILDGTLGYCGRSLDNLLVLFLGLLCLLVWGVMMGYGPWRIYKDRRKVRRHPVKRVLAGGRSSPPEDPLAKRQRQGAKRQLDDLITRLNKKG